MTTGNTRFLAPLTVAVLLTLSRAASAQPAMYPVQGPAGYPFAYGPAVPGVKGLPAQVQVLPAIAPPEHPAARRAERRAAARAERHAAARAEQSAAMRPEQPVAVGTGKSAVQAKTDTARPAPKHLLAAH